jgi:hypothetical protein
MLRRCYVPEEPAYKYYGARGIKICDEWLKDRSAFLKWSIENGYSDRLTIDRINVYGNYEPNNCRWVGMDVQLKNKHKRGTFTDLGNAPYQKGGE